MNGWFPRINSRGDIASGNTETWITYADGTQKLVVPAGGGPVWLTQDSFVFNNGTGQQLWPSGEVTQGYNAVSSDEQGNWAGYLAVGPGRLDVYQGATLIQQINAAGAPRLKPGVLAYITPVQSEEHTIVVNGKPVFTGRVVDYMLSEPVVPMVATGTYTRAYVGAEVIQPTEGAPVLSDGWVCSNAGNREGLYVRPLDSTTGYFLPGEWFYSDFRKIGDTLIVAASTSNGQLKVKKINVNEPRRDLKAIPVPGDSISPPPPPPPPGHPPVDLPPKDPTVPSAPNKLDVVRAVMAAHPEIDRMAEVVRGKITDYVVLTLGGRPWGRKDRDKDPNNNNNSDDALCYLLSDGRFEIYDIISGGDGSASWDYKGTFADGENGYFRDVPGSVPPPPTGPGNPLPPSGDAVTAAIRGLIAADIAPLQSKVAEQATALKAAEAKIAALEARPSGGATKLDGARVALRTDNGHYLTAELGGGGDVNATRERVGGGWEIFTLETK